MICDNCGCSNVRQREISGYIVVECQVCGHLHGNADEIAKIKEMQEAEALGMGHRIFALHKTMEKIPTVKLIKAHEGSAPDRMPPYVSFTVTNGNYNGLEIFLKSLEKVNRTSKVRWIVEATYQKRLTFSLKPNFHHDPHYITPEEVALAQEDLELIQEYVADDISSGKYWEDETETV